MNKSRIMAHRSKTHDLRHVSDGMMIRSVKVSGMTFEMVLSAWRLGFKLTELTL